MRCRNSYSVFGMWAALFAVLSFSLIAPARATAAGELQAAIDGASNGAVIENINNFSEVVRIEGKSLTLRGCRFRSASFKFAPCAQVEDSSGTLSFESIGAVRVKSSSIVAYLAGFATEDAVIPFKLTDCPRVWVTDSTIQGGVASLYPLFPGYWQRRPATSGVVSYANPTSDVSVVFFERTTVSGGRGASPMPDLVEHAALPTAVFGAAIVQTYGVDSEFYGRPADDGNSTAIVLRTNWATPTEPPEPLKNVFDNGAFCLASLTPTPSPTPEPTATPSLQEIVDAAPDNSTLTGIDLPMGTFLANGKNLRFVNCSFLEAKVYNSFGVVFENCLGLLDVVHVERVHIKSHHGKTAGMLAGDVPIRVKDCDTVWVNDTVLSGTNAGVRAIFVTPDVRGATAAMNVEGAATTVFLQNCSLGGGAGITCPLSGSEIPAVDGYSNDSRDPAPAIVRQGAGTSSQTYFQTGSTFFSGRRQCPVAAPPVENPALATVSLPPAEFAAAFSVPFFGGDVPPALPAPTTLQNLINAAPNGATIRGIRAPYEHVTVQDKPLHFIDCSFLQMDVNSAGFVDLKDCEGTLNLFNLVAARVRGHRWNGVPTGIAGDASAPSAISLTNCQSAWIEGCTLVGGNAGYVDVSGSAPWWRGAASAIHVHTVSGLISPLTLYVKDCALTGGSTTYACGAGHLDAESVEFADDAGAAAPALSRSGLEEYPPNAYGIGNTIVNGSSTQCDSPADSLTPFALQAGDPPNPAIAYFTNEFFTAPYTALQTRIDTAAEGDVIRDIYEPETNAVATSKSLTLINCTFRRLDASYATCLELKNCTGTLFLYDIDTVRLDNVTVPPLPASPGATATSANIADCGQVWISNSRFQGSDAGPWTLTAHGGVTYQEFWNATAAGPAFYAATAAGRLPAVFCIVDSDLRAGSAATCPPTFNTSYTTVYEAGAYPVAPIYYESDEVPVIYTRRSPLVAGPVKCEAYRTSPYPWVSPATEAFPPQAFFDAFAGNSTICGHTEPAKVQHIRGCISDQMPPDGALELNGDNLLDVGDMIKALLLP